MNQLCYLFMDGRDQTEKSIGEDCKVCNSAGGADDQLPASTRNFRVVETANGGLGRDYQALGGDVDAALWSNPSRAIVRRKSPGKVGYGREWMAQVPPEDATGNRVRDNFDWRDLRGLGKLLGSMCFGSQSQARSVA
jgi:hypothetical protein